MLILFFFSSQDRRGVSGCEGASWLHSGRLWVGQLPHLHPVLIQVSTVQYCAPASTSVSVLLFYFSAFLCTSLYLYVLYLFVLLCTPCSGLMRCCCSCGIEPAITICQVSWIRFLRRNLYRYLQISITTIYIYLFCQGEGDGMMKTLEEINVEQ